MGFDHDQFEERAAIQQYDGGMTRFAAETAAAQAQGVPRWQAIKWTKEARDAERDGHFARGGDPGLALARERGPVDLPGVQPQPEEKNRSVPERDPEV